LNPPAAVSSKIVIRALLSELANEVLDAHHVVGCMAIWVLRLHVFSEYLALTAYHLRFNFCFHNKEQSGKLINQLLLISFFRDSDLTNVISQLKDSPL
jgi:hypothetical protein